VLTELQSTADIAHDYEAIELALWFHDAIYKIGSTTNEKDSADWAVIFLKSNNCEDTFTRQVYDLVIATEHNHTPVDSDQQLMVDIDLSILGKPSDIYEQFEQNIRREYKIVPWLIYRKRRIAILRGFLDRKSIYSHDYFQQQYEASARQNLTGAIETLQRN